MPCKRDQVARARPARPAFYRHDGLWAEAECQSQVMGMETATASCPIDVSSHQTVD